MLPGLISLYFWDIKMVGSEVLCKWHESVDPSCFLLMVQTVEVVIVFEILSWHTLGPLLPTDHRLHATAYLTIGADHVHPTQQ